MKSILMSIQPYYGFLIIAKAKGWDLEKYGLHEKTVEMRKRIPTSPDWDNKAAFYFSKDKKSLARIPEEYRGEVAELCGKVVCEFVCDEVYNFIQAGAGIMFADKELNQLASQDARDKTCLTDKEIEGYLNNSEGYGLHISDLKIYDKPKELSEFGIPCNCDDFGDGYKCNKCSHQKSILSFDDIEFYCDITITRPPQSWCYVEELD